MEISRAAYLEVNLDKLENNLKEIERVTQKRSKIIAIVKSNAYHFGDEMIAKKLLGLGVDFFAVANMNEALSLRKKFEDIRILILGPAWGHMVDEGIRKKITFTVSSFEEAEILNSRAEKLNTKAICHIAVDTGMGRIGFRDNYEEAARVFKLCNIEVEGIFTHFAKSDSDPDFTREQYVKLLKFKKELWYMDCDIKLFHSSNSHAIMGHRVLENSYIRPGIILYGSPEGDKRADDMNLSFIGSLKSEISFIKTLRQGEGVSYGHLFVADKETEVATIPIGYADGIIRSLSGKIDVLINGKRCRQIGRICMDQMMVDVTGLGARLGDEVVIIGEQGDEKITIEEIAEKAGEIPTSYLTHLSERLPRVYIENGKVVKIIDYILQR